MSETDSCPPGKRRLQVPLWFLLFIVPAVVAVGCAVYAAWARETRLQAELSTQFALAAQEKATAATRLGRLQRLNAALDRKQEEWQSVERVIFHVQQHPRDSSPDLSGSRKEYFGLRLIHPSIHFYVQMDDGDMRQLVARLIKLYPSADETIQYRILDCLANLPDYVEPQRLDGIRSVVQEFVEPQQEHSRAVIRDKAREALKAFELPKETGRD